jgi:adenylate cyclase
MAAEAPQVLDELVRASSLLTGEINFKRLISILVEQSLDITHSDTAALYLYASGDTTADLVLAYKRGRHAVPEHLAGKSELVDFIVESSEAVVLLTPEESPFGDLLLTDRMQSGMALPIATTKTRIGILVLNSLRPHFYNRARFQFLDSFVGLASGMLHNAKMFTELQDYLKQIEELERYQASVFSSMTNLLVTTDDAGRVHYFNRAAADRLGVTETNIGQKLDSVFGKGLSKRVISSLDRVRQTGSSILGIEGIYRDKGGDMDYSLNVSPLVGKRGRHEGLTLLFTDQTAETELKQQMEVVSEERRLIKDMFARYLSNDIVQSLMDKPELVKPGGGAKEATIFFADIRGYTSFSEGKDPAYIVEVLNDYFTEAVEVVIRHRGYIDKFIGDCIMAAWGVPMVNEEYDAVQAVTCAVEIQELVNSKSRSFFTGKASKLRIGIGMHTGPLIAGNLGSARRMDYTVIGDTVNVAARMEGVAGAGEVIITGETRKHLGDAFKLQEREPVKVKGKTKAIPIYNVIGKN